MPSIGAVWWTAEIRQAEAAAGKANDLQEGLDETAASADRANDAMNDTSKSAKVSGDSMERSRGKAGRLKGAMGLLTSSLFFFTPVQAAATAATKAYATAAALAAGASKAYALSVAALSSVLTAPVVLAAAVLTAVAAVGLLGSELLGLTDVTPVAEAEAATMSAAFVDMAFLVGGPLVGYLSAAFSALTGDFAGAKQKFVNTSVEWTKAAARFAARVQAGLKAFGVSIKTGVRATIAAIDYAWRAGWNALAGWTVGIINDINQSITDGIQGAVNAAVDALNSLIEKANRVPTVDIGTVGRVDMAAPQLAADAGQVANESLQSRIQGVRDRGRQELAQISATGQAQLERFSADTIGGDRATAGAGGGGVSELTRPSQEPQVERTEQTVNQDVSVEIGDQSMDLSNMSRSDRQDLADRIADQFGDEIEAQVTK
jgi:hypothetical protein